MRVWCLALAFLSTTEAFSREVSKIHLHNGTIETESAARRSEMAGLMQGKPATGLFVIQFAGPVSPAQRAELKQSGVTLLNYLPEYAYIARFNRVSPGAVAGLKAARWVGNYPAEYKIHPRLAAELKGKKNSKQKAPAVAVSLLLSPDATPAEKRQVRALLAREQTESQSPLGTILTAEISPANLAVLAQTDATLWIEPALKRKLYDEAATKIVGGDDGQVATPALTQQLGFNGAGVTVCVADTGLDTGNTNTMHPDLLGRVTGMKFYGNNITDSSDGYGHGTHCAGIVAGNAVTGETDPDSGALYGLGIAPGAKLFIERIFDDYGSEANPFPSDEILTRDAVRNGAKIGSNSWGNDSQGEYDLDAMQFDALVRDADAGTPGYQPYILEFSAGNAGPAAQTIGSPACAKNVIATGASQNVPNTLAATYGLYADGPDVMADFSSRGPCADGRIKPDLVAPGTWIASAASAFALDLANTSWTVIDDRYVYMGGTSMAGPYAAGAAAVFVQFYQSTHTNAVPSPALVKAALINSATELDQANGGPGPVPNHDEGWGRITLTNIITTNVAGAPRYYQYLDQTVLLTNSQVYAQHVFVQSAGQPLKITLAYTDVPGFPGAIPALVNDLDLEVVAPDGTLYRGNQFGAGESVPNAPTPDRLNNVEGIYLSQPAPGDYLIRVRASSVVQDALTNSAAMDQDFALVSSGDLVRPGTGFILLDRPSYTAPGAMNLSVFDADRAGNSSVNVTVTNLTAHTFTTKTLNAAGNYGAFTGAVATVTGVASAGQIQIANGNNLEAVYFDSSATKRIATAVADIGAPVISVVTNITDLGVLTITWQTSEPANSIVRYGTNSSNLNLGVTNAALVTNHVIKLTKLIPDKTYYYSVSSSDAAGNMDTNNNAVALAPTFTLVSFTNRQFRFTVSGTAGANYVVEATTNLNPANWIPIMTNAAPFVFTESNVNAFPQRFYRSLALPSATHNFIGIATPTVLLVDAFDTAWESANGTTVIPDSVYTNVLNAAGIPFGFWKVNDRGSPQLADLKPFPIVIWRITDDAVSYGYDADGVADPTATNNTLNAQQQYMIQSYLNGGGSFFMASMEILSHLGNAPFRRNVLQVANFTQNTSLLGICADCDEDHGVPAFFGAPASVADGMFVTLNYTNYPSYDLGLDESGGSLYGPDFSDTFTPSSDATAITFESVSGKSCGMSYPNLGVDSPGRVVFLSFPFDAIPTNGAAPNNSVALLQKVVRFLAPGLNGAGEIALDNSVYTTNDLVTVEVGDSDLTGAGQLSVSFVATNAVQTNQTTVTLRETTHPGLFRGNLTLVSGVATNGALRVANGSVLRAIYFDASNNSNVVALASIDTVPPGITNVAAATDYYNARVTWQTTKPSDSAVQYGALNQPPANSVYDGTLTTNHSLTINGLVPNRVYHFQVVSRDQAGNITVDDNGGNYYTFTTLKGLTPPWSDNLETNAPGWSVVAGASTEINWTLGQPNNTLATSAHSGTNAWGSNLQHQSFTYAESYLYSPAIDLSGMSEVTLTFWHNYNLTSGLEYGELGVSTNNSAPPSSIPTLASFTGEASGGWVQETVDLSGYAGQTIQVVWYYGAIAFFGTLDGWLVDDVSITGTVAGGTISITKNLGQGSWSLSTLSPLGLVPVTSGTAPATTLNNLPADTYVVQFGDAPFYQSPSPQTNTLVENGSLNFTGNYTFPDANNNGISDAFEINYFGNLSTNRTQFTDTDGDGMTDAAEFIAGTNPTNAASRFYFTGETLQGNNLIQLQWTAVSNRLYQVNASTNLINWSALSGWLQATSQTAMSYTVTNAGSRKFYRAQVQP